MENGLTKNLPDLIDLAIADAGKLDRDFYLPYHSTYYSPNDPVYGSCNVCLAGVVLAGTLNYLSSEPIRLGSVAFNDVREQLYALEFVRTGDYLAAARELDYNLTDVQVELLRRVSDPVDMYFTNWESFESHVESLKDVSKKLRGILK